MPHGRDVRSPGRNLNVTFDLKYSPEANRYSSSVRQADVTVLQLQDGSSIGVTQNSVVVCRPEAAAASTAETTSTSKIAGITEAILLCFKWNSYYSRSLYVV